MKDLPAKIRNRLTARLFDAPIMQNQIRPLYVEAMIEEVLGPNWRYVGGNWAGYDFESDKGVRLEVKQSAAIQPWSAQRGTVTRGVFDIRERTGYYGEDGITWTPGAGRHAQIYVFAWHPISDATADHRDPDQWRFYVVMASALPSGRKAIGLKAIEHICQPVGLGGLRASVSSLVSL